MDDRAEAGPPAIPDASAGGMALVRQAGTTFLGGHGPAAIGIELLITVAAYVAYLRFGAPQEARLTLLVGLFVGFIILLVFGGRALLGAPSALLEARDLSWQGLVSQLDEEARRLEAEVATLSAKLKSDRLGWRYGRLEYANGEQAGVIWLHNLVLTNRSDDTISLEMRGCWELQGGLLSSPPAFDVPRALPLEPGKPVQLADVRFAASRWEFDDYGATVADGASVKRYVRFYDLRTESEVGRIEVDAPDSTHFTNPELNVELQELLLRDLSPASRLERTRDWFTEVAAAAKAGNTLARERLVRVATIFLDASRDYNASGPAYWVDHELVEQVKRDLGSLPRDR